MCKPQPGKRDGVKWGICHNGGNMVYLEPRKIKRASGSGYIYKPISSCGMHEKGEYTGVCPVCGKTMWICKSIRMEMGANTGSGICPGCKKLLHMTFNEERKEMKLERFKDY